MMKYIKNIALMLMVATFGLCSLVACGSDDDNGTTNGGSGQNGNVLEKLIGTWTNSYGDVYVFRANGTGELTVYEEDEVYYDPFSYYYDDASSELNLYFEDEPETYTLVSISASRLVWIDSYGDREVLTKGGSGSEGGDDKPVSPTLNLVGTWRYTYNTGYCMLQFKSDGTGYMLEVDDEEDEMESFTYIYDAESGNIYMTFGDETEVWKVMKDASSSTQLVLFDGEDYATFLKVG